MDSGEWLGKVVLLVLGSLIFPIMVYNLTAGRSIDTSSGETPSPNSPSGETPSPNSPSGKTPNIPLQFDLSGTWTNFQGGTYIIIQVDNNISIQSVDPMGVIIVNSKGLIKGREIELNYQRINGDYGTAILTISPGEREIKGKVYSEILRTSQLIIMYR
jgi:hypothetical protein